MKSITNNRWFKPSFGLMLIGVSYGSFAAEISLDPAISTKVEYNDNLNLSSSDETEVSSMNIIPSLDFWYKQPRWQTKAAARLISSDYTGAQSLDKTDSFLTGQFDHQTTEKLTTGLGGSYTRDTTLDSDFFVTGLVFDRFRRESWDITPTARYAWTSELETSFQYQHADLNFIDDISGTDFSEYASDSVDAIITYNLTEIDQVSTGLSYLSYTTDADPLETTQVKVYQPGINLGWSRQQNETLNYSLNIGARNTKTKLLFPETTTRLIPGFGPINVPTGNVATLTPDADTGYTYTGSISKALETSNLSLTVSQEVTPSSTSGLTETLSLRGQYDRHLSEKFDAILKLNHINSNSVLGTASTTAANSINNTTSVINPELRWHFEQDWYLALAYRYTKQTNDASLSEASGNLGYVEIKYDWPKTSVSR